MNLICLTNFNSILTFSLFQLKLPTELKTQFPSSTPAGWENSVDSVTLTPNLIRARPQSMAHKPVETFACLTCGSLNCIHPQQNQQTVRVRTFTAHLAGGGTEEGERRRSQNSAGAAAASAAPTRTFPSRSSNL